MKTFLSNWKKLSIWHKGVCAFLLFWAVRGWYTGAVELTIFCGVILLIYWSRETMDPEERKKLIAGRKFKSGFSDPQDLGNPCGFNNPASPLYHMHNSPSISSSFDQYRG